MQGGVRPRLRLFASASLLLIAFIAMGIAYVHGTSAASVPALEGLVAEDHGDNFANGVTHRFLSLQTATERISLTGPGAAWLKPGERVRVHGERNGGRLFVSGRRSFEVVAAATQTSGSTADGSVSPSEVSSTATTKKKVAVLLVNFGPSPTPTPTPTPPPAGDSYAALCSANLRDAPALTGGLKATAASGTQVTVVETVSGSSWSASCFGSKSGSDWLKINAVNGTAVSALYGVEFVYAATGLFEVVASGESAGAPDVTATASEPWTKAAVRNIYFDGARSVAAFYNELSNGNWVMTGDVFGYYTLSVSTSKCDYNGWANAANAAANAAGVSLSTYTNIAYVFPKQSACDWGGLAQIVGARSWINGNPALYVSAHELGHNFGTHHASSYTCTKNGARVQISASCTRDEYGDPFDVMGANDRNNGNAHHMNNWHRRQVGMLSSASDQVTVSASGRYTVAAAALAGGFPRIVRVLRSDGDYYYLEYRPPYGAFDAWLTTDPVASGVLVRIAPPGNRAVQSRLIDCHPETVTFKDAACAVGESFYDSANQITVVPRSLSPSGAVVYIQIGPDVTAPTAPTPLKATLASPGVLNLSWSAAFDENGVTGYQLSRDGVLIASQSGTSYVDTDIATGTSYQYQVSAVDPFGNVGAAATVRFDYALDRLAPDISAPRAIIAAGAQAGQPKIPLALSWTAADPSGIKATVLQQRVDGGAWRLITLPASDSQSIVLMRKPGRTYQFRVRATDMPGNTSSWAKGPVFKLVAKKSGSAKVVYTRSWSQMAASTAYSGTLRYTSRLASASMVFTGRAIAWVAPMGPKRGTATVHIDGKQVATIDLYAATERPRQIVFSRSWDTSAGHTIKVSVSGTRVDIDAFAFLK